jgi:hypothetical protein
MKPRAPGAHLRSTIIKRSSSIFQPQLEVDEGELIAKVAIRDERTPYYYADFSIEFVKRPNITRAIASAFVTMGNGRRKGTVDKIEKHLKLFLGPFLDGLKLSFGKDVNSPEHVTREVTDCYLDWLYGKVKMQLGAQGRRPNLSAISIGPVFRCVRKAFEILGTSPTWKGKLNPDLSFARNPTPGAHENIKHRSALSEADLRLIRNACQREASATLEKLDRGNAALRMPPKHVDFNSPSDTPFKTLENSLRACIHQEENGYFGEKIFIQKMPGFARASRGRHFIKQELREHLHFTASTIIPFVCLCEMEFLFSVDSHLLLEWKDIGPAMMKGRLRVQKIKNRGDVVQVRTLKANDHYEFSAAVLLEHLRKNSERTRTLVSPIFKDRVFVFVDAKGQAKGFESQNNSGMFRNNLLAFIKRNKLPHFTLAQLKPTATSITGADIVSIVSQDVV